MAIRNFSSSDDLVGAVFTPLRWAKWLVRKSKAVTKWCEGASVCDPTAGVGVFAHALMDVASEDGVHVTDDMLRRVFLVERQAEFIRDFRENFRREYCRSLPIENTIHSDVVLHNSGRKFDILVGNPPWANFNDLPRHYAEALKPAFIESGLIEDTQLLLLGCARVDIAALVLTLVIRHNLRSNGEGYFFVPLSLFQNDGAHAGFRRYRSSEVSFCPTEIWEFPVKDVFPEVATRVGAVRFVRDLPADYPIPYHVLKGDRWTSRVAAPLGALNAPLSVADSPLQLDGISQTTFIEVRENQKPRQGVNTCGANHAYIFDKLPKEIPAEFAFPLITKECFREEDPMPRKEIILPYDQITGKPLLASQLSAHSALEAHFRAVKSDLLARKGTLLNTWIKRGCWWACLGVGPYSFAPFKVVWEAYGKTNFYPKIFGSHHGQPWQPNQAMQAFIPCLTINEAEDLLEKLRSSKIQTYLESMNVSGTCNWAQPGRIKRFLRFTPEPVARPFELELTGI